jgi:hypothetical protein
LLNGLGNRRVYEEPRRQVEAGLSDTKAGAQQKWRDSVEEAR